MNIQQIHHVAYRCKDAKETVDFYTRYLNMDFILAISEDRVPSTKEPDPYMHVFLDAGSGNILAFFELPNSPEMGKDPNTLQLDAGIVGESSISNARKSFPLDDFYMLIDEISWI